MIVKTFGYSVEEDQRATDILSKLVVGKSLGISNLQRKIKDRSIIVFGAGPSLDGNVQEIMRMGLHKRCILMSADGATTALIRNAHVIPDFIATDLDGRIDDLLRANELGATVVIHGHGDNINALREHVPRFKNIIGTTQVEPRPNVYNFGGFTDGDRCAFLAEEMGAKVIALAGMDLGYTVGKYSKPRFKTDRKASEVKRKKLEIARKLLEWLATWANAELINVTGSGERIKGIKEITCEDLLEICEDR